MREIKFNVWDQVNKMMLYDVSTGTIEIWCSRTGKKAQSKDCIFLQSTGLKDKNGKKVYEGDVIEHSFSPGRKSIFVLAPVVSFLDLWAQLNIKRYGQIDTPELFDLNDQIEVVGNIYKNPELLKS